MQKIHTEFVYRMVRCQVNDDVIASIVCAQCCAVAVKLLRSEKLQNYIVLVSQATTKESLAKICIFHKMKYLNYVQC